MRSDLAAEPRCTRQDHFAWAPAGDRPRTAQELQLAADMQMAVGNRQRAELLSWQAHQVRCETSA